MILLVSVVFMLCRSFILYVLNIVKWMYFIVLLIFEIIMNKFYFKKYSVFLIEIFMFVKKIVI